MHNLKADKKEAQSIQQVDLSPAKHVKAENPLFGRTASDRPLDIPPDNLSPSTIDKNFCPGSGRRTYPHQKFADKEAQGDERD